MSIERLHPSEVLAAGSADVSPTRLAAHSRGWSSARSDLLVCRQGASETDASFRAAHSVEYVRRGVGVCARGLGTP